MQHGLCQAVGIARGRVVDATAVRIDVEGAIRLDRHPQAERLQRRHDGIAAAVELRLARIVDRQRLGGEAGQRGVLGNGRGADEEVLRHFLEGADQFVRHHQPAQAPASHIEVLGEAVDGDHVVVQAQRRYRRRVVRQTLVDLVDDGKALAGPHGLQDARQLVRQDRCAGGVGRRCQQHATGLFAPVGLHLLGRELEALGRAARDHLRAAVESGDEMPVAGVAGVGHQHFRADLHQHGAGQQQRGRGTGGHHHAARRDVDPVHGLVIAGDGLAQRCDAQRAGVLGHAAAHGGLGGPHHGLGGGEVGLADPHVDDVAPGALEFGGLLGQLHHVEGVDIGKAGGGG